MRGPGLGTRGSGLGASVDKRLVPLKLRSSESGGSGLENIDAVHTKGGLAGPPFVLSFAAADYAQLKPCLLIGSVRMRSPVAAKIALATDGITGGSDGSPRPVGLLFDFTQCASMTGGAC